MWFLKQEMLRPATHDSFDCCLKYDKCLVLRRITDMSVFVQTALLVKLPREWACDPHS